MGSLSFSITEIAEVRRFCDHLDAAKMAGAALQAPQAIVVTETKGRRAVHRGRPLDSTQGNSCPKLYDKYRHRLKRLSDELEVEVKGDRLAPRGGGARTASVSNNQSAHAAAGASRRGSPTSTLRAPPGPESQHPEGG